MVDTHGRSRPRQANIINARSRLHSPLFRHGRSATSSRADDDGNDDGSADDPLVRETPLYRHKQSFFGRDFDATVAASAPVRASPMAVASDSGRPPHRGGAARSSTGSTVALDEEAHGECHSESALDAGWDTPLLTAENIGRAFSSVSRAGSASQLRAVSSEVSDSLSRMKMRKQEIEMASLVHKVQSQLRTMEDVIKELQNEHAIKNEMIKKQMNETNRILAERDQLQMELRRASQKSAAPLSNDMTHLRSSLQSFMQQTEQTQFLMMEQLKSIEVSKGSPQRRHSVDAQKIETSVKAAMSEFAALQQNMMQALAPPTQPTSPVQPKQPEKPVEKPVEKPRSLPPVKAASSAWKTAFFAMIGIWLVTLGVGAAQHFYGLDLYSFVARETREMHVLVETIQEIEAIQETETKVPETTTMVIVDDVVTVHVNTDGAVDAPVPEFAASVNATASTGHDVKVEAPTDAGVVAATSGVNDTLGDVHKDSDGNDDAATSTQVDAPVVDVKEQVVTASDDVVVEAKEVIVEGEQRDADIKEDTVVDIKGDTVDEVKEDTVDEVKDSVVHEVKRDTVDEVKQVVVDVAMPDDEAIELGAKENTSESKSVEADEVVRVDARDDVNATATAELAANASELVQVVDVVAAVVEVVTDVSSEIVDAHVAVIDASNASIAIVEAESQSNATAIVDAAEDEDVVDAADESTPVVPVVDVIATPVDSKSEIDDSAPEPNNTTLLTDDDQATDEALEALPEALDASKEAPEAAKDEVSKDEPEASEEEDPEAAKQEDPEVAEEEDPEAAKDAPDAELVAANDAPEIAASQDAALVAIVTQFSAYTSVTAHALNTSAVTSPLNVTETTDGAPTEDNSATTDDAPVVNTDDAPVVDTDAEPVVPNTVDEQETTPIEAPVSDSALVESNLEATSDIPSVAAVAPADVDAASVVAASEAVSGAVEEASADDESEATSSSENSQVLSAAAKALESLLADK